MYLIPIAWLYVALMMAVAEATSPVGTVLGAVITFVLYGVGPVALILYFIGRPARRRARLAREQARLQASGQPDGGSEPATGAVPPVREEP